MIRTELLNNNQEMRIRMPEKFDFNIHRDLRTAYQSNKCQFYRIDMENTAYMDSSALGMLLQIKEYAGDGDKAVVIEHANENIKEILKIANFEKIMVIN